MVERLTPKSNRAQMDFRGIESKFSGAVANVSKIGGVNLSQMGIDWNPSILTSTGKSLSYSISNLYSDSTEPIKGKIRNCGHDKIGIEIYNPNMIGRSGYGNDEIIRCLSEAVEYSDKLEILDETTFLPMGETGEKTPKESKRKAPEVERDLIQYRLFAEKLLNMANKIIKGRSEGSFGDYVVAQMPSGFFVAYNANYGEGPYVVTDLDILLQDKTTIRKNNDAIRFRRDRRAGNKWIDRILATVKD